MVFKSIKFVQLKDEFWFMTAQTMSKNQKRSSSSKGLSLELNWDVVKDLDYIAGLGWQNELTTP